jgi:hypothetical protein
MNVPMAERSLGLERSHSLSLFHFHSIFAGARSSSSSSTDAPVGDGDKSGRVREERGGGVSKRKVRRDLVEKSVLKRIFRQKLQSWKVWMKQE